MCIDHTNQVVETSQGLAQKIESSFLFFFHLVIRGIHPSLVECWILLNWPTCWVHTLCQLCVLGGVSKSQFSFKGIFMPFRRNVWVCLVPDHYSACKPTKCKVTASPSLYDTLYERQGFAYVFDPNSFPSLENKKPSANFTPVLMSSGWSIESIYGAFCSEVGLWWYL